MTPEYTPETIAIVLRCLRVQTEGPGPICPVCVHQTGLVDFADGVNTITAAGHLVLALAAERDEFRTALEREKRLHSLLFDQRRLEIECASWCSELDEAEEQGEGDEEIERLNGEIEKAAGASEAARAAYVAAGGTV